MCNHSHLITKRLYNILILISIYSCRGLYNFTSHNLSTEVKTYNITIPVDTASRKANMIIDMIKKKLSEKLQNIGLVYGENGDISFKISLSKINIDRKGKINELQTAIDIEYKNFKNKVQKLNISKNKQLPKGSVDISVNIIDIVTNEITEEIWDQTLSSW